MASLFSAQGLRSRAADALRAGLTAAQKFAWSPPLVPGVGNNAAWQGRQKDLAAQQILNSRDAMYGRATAQLGPVQNYISTYPGSGLTPETIARIHNEVMVAGYMLNKACLDEQILLRDAQIETVDRAVRVDVIGNCDKFSMEPADDSELARQLVDFDDTWVRDIDRFNPAMYELLFGNAAGYALQEAIYEEREIQVLTHVNGKQQFVTFSGPFPRQLAWVSNKHTCFDVTRDEVPRLDCGNGKSVEIPEHKFLTYICPGSFQTRRRGYMYQAVWLHLLKHAAMARWGVVLDIWGIPVPYGIADRGLWQDETRKAEMRLILQNYGRGIPAIFTDDFELKEGPLTSAGDARGMHAALIGWANQELMKLIQGETLTTELGGVGGYNTSETHADSKEAVVRMIELCLSDCLRSFVRAVNVLHMDQICSTYGCKPHEVLRRTPRPTWRIERAVTPQVALNMADVAVNNLRLPLDAGTLMRKFGWKQARNTESQVRGKLEVLPDGGSAVSTNAATQSADVKGGAPGGASMQPVELTPGSLGTIITVNEARQQRGLSPIEGGDIPVEEYRLKIAPPAGPGGQPNAKPATAEE